MLVTRWHSPPHHIMLCWKRPLFIFYVRFTRFHVQTIAHALGSATISISSIRLTFCIWWRPRQQERSGSTNDRTPNKTPMINDEYEFMTNEILFLWISKNCNQKNARWKQTAMFDTTWTGQPNDVTAGVRTSWGFIEHMCMWCECVLRYPIRLQFIFFCLLFWLFFVIVHIHLLFGAWVFVRGGGGGGENSFTRRFANEANKYPHKHQSNEVTKMGKHCTSSSSYMGLSAKRHSRKYREREDKMANAKNDQAQASQKPFIVVDIFRKGPDRTYILCLYLFICCLWTQKGLSNALCFNEHSRRVYRRRAWAWAPCRSDSVATHTHIHRAAPAIEHRAKNKTEMKIWKWNKLESISDEIRGLYSFPFLCWH